MFGYVMLNKPEIRFREYDEYRSYYCGLCRELKEQFHIAGQLTLTYDMTFVLLLLDGLYEPPVQKGKSCCAVHPLKKQLIRKSGVTEYAAAMNLLLSYYKCMDDWTDERKISRLAFAGALKNGESKVEKKYPEKAKAIRELLNELSEMEKAGEKNIDRVSGCFGSILAEVLAYKQDMWEPSLRKIGFYLGKFIYILDAYEDIEKDMKNGNYNPFCEVYIMDTFEKDVRHMLLMMMAEVGREYEKLPIFRHGDLLRNILYSGVWCRYTTISEQRKKQQEKNDGSI